jgi:hypothetical protein
MENDEVFDGMYTRPYAEDDALLNDFINNLIRHLSWEMFVHQEETCYDITEKNPPMLKDNVIDYMQTAINNALEGIRDYVICRMLMSYRLSNIDLGEEAESYLRDSFGEEEWAKFEEIAKKYIWNDYARFCGVKGAKNYFTRIGRTEYIPAEE